MPASVAVVTDSAASIPSALAARWGVRVVPLHVIVDGQDFAEGDEITPAEVLDHLNAGSTVTTSQPSVAAFADAYAAAAAEGATAIVAVMISGGLSGTCANAQSAAADAPVPVTVIDTRTVAMATGYAALAAAVVASRGSDARTVAAEARRVASSSTCLFTVDTLDFLRRGGRIPPAAAALGTLLGVRPILEMSDGGVIVADRIRTTAKARAALVARIDEAIARCEHPAVAVMALGDAAYADGVAADLEHRHPNVVIMVRTPVSAVLSAHSGPGTLAAVVADVPTSLH